MPPKRKSKNEGRSRKRLRSSDGESLAGSSTTELRDETENVLEPSQQTSSYVSPKESDASSDVSVVLSEGSASAVPSEGSDDAPIKKLSPQQLSGTECEEGALFKRKRQTSNEGISSRKRLRSAPQEDKTESREEMLEPSQDSTECDEATHSEHSESGVVPQDGSDNGKVAEDEGKLALLTTKSITDDSDNEEPTLNKILDVPPQESDDDEDESTKNNESGEGVVAFSPGDSFGGEEPGCSTVYGGIEVTPFNLVEEMTEGHFDKEGTFIFKKDPLPKDQWLESIDWRKVPHAGPTQDEEPSEKKSDEPPLHTLFQKLLTFLKEGETINKALKRLSDQRGLSASEKLKLKKSGASPDFQKSPQSTILYDLSELANKILKRTGNLDIYDEEYKFLVNEAKDPEEGQSSSSPVLDMFAE